MLLETGARYVGPSAHQLAGAVHSAVCSSGVAERRTPTVQKASQSRLQNHLQRNVVET